MIILHIADAILRVVAATVWLASIIQYSFSLWLFLRTDVRLNPTLSPLLQQSVFLLLRL